MMVDVVIVPAPARLPRADWIALGVGILIIFFSFFWPPVQVLVTVALFLPPVLRETGLLKDAELRPLHAMRRAGFHAFLSLVAMFLLSYVLVRQGILTETAHSSTAILNESYLRGILVGVYLVSYLLQVLGPRMGSFGVLLGAAILALAPIPGHFLGNPNRSFPSEGVVVAVGASLLLAMLAFLVRQRPGLAGWVLAGMFVAGALLIPLLGYRHLPIESSLSIFLQMGLLMGCTGFALLRSSAEQRSKEIR